MKKKILIIVLSIFTMGCFGSKRVEQVLTTAEKNNAALRAENKRLEKKIEDLSNTVLLLQDRLDTMKLGMEKRVERKPLRKEKLAAHPMVETNEPFLKANDPKEASLPTLKLSNKDLGQDAQVARTPESSDENPEATRAYNEAFKKFEAESYTEAVSALDDFVHKFPTHAYADNAIFWIGESFFRMTDYSNAVTQFERVAKEYPTGNKVPDALLRAGDCYIRMSKTNEAQKSFEKVIQLYPKSIAAEKARAWMAQSSSEPTHGRM